MIIELNKNDIIKGIKLIIVSKVIANGFATTLKKYSYIPKSINKAAPLIPGTILPMAYNTPAINMVMKPGLLNVSKELFSIKNNKHPNNKDIKKDNMDIFLLVLNLISLNK